MKPVRLAILISLCAAASASAQTGDASTAEFWDAFGRNHAPRAVIVIDEAGIETKGRLVLQTADQLTLAVDDGRHHTFLRSRVAAVYQSGDSVKNGAAIGFVIGAGWGLLTRPDLGCSNAQSTKQRQCTTKENVGFAAINSIMGAGVGAGIGALVDKLIPGRRLVYKRP